MSTIRATYIQHGSSSVPNITLNASGEVILASGIISSGTFSFTSGTASAPGIAVSGDADTGIYSPAANKIAVTTSGTERLIVDDTGNVGIGTTSPSNKLVVSNGAEGFEIDPGISANKNVILHYNRSTPAYVIAENRAAQHIFAISANEAARIDTDSRLLVGTSTARNIGVQRLLQIEGTDSTNPGAHITLNSSAGASAAAAFVIARTRGTAVGSQTAVENNDVLGYLAFAGANGTDTSNYAGWITCAVDGVPFSSGDTTDLPGRLAFYTTADGNASPTERMRITNTGGLKVSSKVYSAAGVGDSNTHVFLNRNNTIGDNCMYLGLDSNAINTSSNHLVCTHYGISDVLYIRGNGNVVNANNSYGAISDIKLKENIVDAGSQWDDLKALQVRNYNFKEGQTHTQIGLIAQEVELVSPGLVSESPDRDEAGNDLGTVTKSVNYSVLYMKAVKALQEAMERIEVLEAKVNALEGN